MVRCELNDSIMDVVTKMSEGNIGCVTALMDVISKGGLIDPDAMLGGVGTILLLDTWGIYGSNIYVLWNDQCNRDIREFMLLLRATQLGYFSSAKLKALSEDEMREGIITDEEWKEMDKKVCEKLENFQRK